MTRRVVVFLLPLLVLGCGRRQLPNGADSLVPPSPPPKPYVLFSLTTDYDGKTEVPVIIRLHGMGDRPELPTIFVGMNGPRILNAAPSGPIFGPEGTFDWSDDIEVNFTRIKEALHEASTKARIRKDQIVLIGYSQGAYAALGLAYAHPEMFAGVIAVNPGSMESVPLPANPSPLLARRGFVLCYGEKDEPEFIRQGKERIDAARKAGAKVKVKTIPNAGHEPPQDWGAWEPEWLDFIFQANKG